MPKKTKSIKVNKANIKKVYKPRQYKVKLALEENLPHIKRTGNTSSRTSSKLLTIFEAPCPSKHTLNGRIFQKQIFQTNFEWTDFSKVILLKI